MPWQQLVVDVGLELLPDGLPAYREVIFTVPRQSGKTTVILTWECHRAVKWGSPQKIIYTAQTGNDARKKLIEDQAPLLDPKSPQKTPMSAAVSRVLSGMGNESISFKNGSRVGVMPKGADAGHGKTVDLGVIDEAFADSDDHREQALIPAMLTKPSAQLLIASTAGTEESVYLNRKIEAGRRAVDHGSNEGIAFFEWSAPLDADIDDPATWFGCMPALGFTQSLGAVQHARMTMTEGEFRRAMLNQPTISDERVIPAHLWTKANTDNASPRGKLTFSLEVNPDRSWASVAVCDESGVVEIVENRERLNWVIECIQAVCGDHSEVVIDSGGPAAPFVSELVALGVKVHEYKTADVTNACAHMFDAIADTKVTFRRDPDLDAAAAGVQQRPLGDRWLWARRDGGVEIAPLMAATLAYDRATAPTQEPEVWAMRF